MVNAGIVGAFGTAAEELAAFQLTAFTGQDVTPVVQTAGTFHRMIQARIVVAFGPVALVLPTLSLTVLARQDQAERLPVIVGQAACPFAQWRGRAVGILAGAVVALIVAALGLAVFACQHQAELFSVVAGQAACALAGGRSIVAGKVGIIAGAVVAEVVAAFGCTLVVAQHGAERFAVGFAQTTGSNRRRRGLNEQEVAMHLGLRPHACFGGGGEKPVGRDYQEILAARQGLERIEPLVIGACFGEELLPRSLFLKQPDGGAGNGDRFVAVGLA